MWISNTCTGARLQIGPTASSTNAPHLNSSSTRFNPCSSLRETDQVSHVYKTTGNTVHNCALRCKVFRPETEDKRERLLVLTAASMKTTVFWDVATCSLVEIYQHLGSNCRLHLQGTTHQGIHPVQPIQYTITQTTVNSLYKVKVYKAEDHDHPSVRMFQLVINERTSIKLNLVLKVCTKTYWVHFSLVQIGEVLHRTSWIFLKNDSRKWCTT
jgi:hypothetical protein